jgi:hypothetical protein
VGFGGDHGFHHGHFRGPRAFNGPHYDNSMITLRLRTLGAAASECLTINCQMQIPSQSTNAIFDALAVVGRSRDMPFTRRVVRRFARSCANLFVVEPLSITKTEGAGMFGLRANWPLATAASTTVTDD